MLNEPEEWWWMEKSQGSVKKKRKGESKGNKRKVMDENNESLAKKPDMKNIFNYVLNYMPGHYTDLFS